MGSFSVDDAAAKLGIYKSEAKALDALDGKEDGKISQDIFTQAQETLKNAEAQYNEDNEGETINLSKFSKVAQALGRSVAQKMGFEAFVSSSNQNEDVEETMSDNEKHDKVGDIVASAVKYIKEHKSLEGFKFTGIPKGVTNLRLDVDDYFGNGDNDIVTFDKDGKAVVEKVIDGISIEVHYTVDNTEYAAGTAIEFEEDNKDDTPAQNVGGTVGEPTTTEAEGATNSNNPPAEVPTAANAGAAAGKVAAEVAGTITGTVAAAVAGTNAAANAGRTETSSDKTDIQATQAKDSEQGIKPQKPRMEV